MAIKITDECINCGACEPECPNTAIYEGGIEWNWSGGTELKGAITTLKSMGRQRWKERIRELQWWIL